MQVKVQCKARGQRTAMEREHTAAADSGDEFTTDNYEVTTTPTIEWWFVAEPEGHAAAWPAEHKIEPPAAPRRPQQPKPRPVRTPRPKRPLLREAKRDRP